MKDFYWNPGRKFSKGLSFKEGNMIPAHAFSAYNQGFPPFQSRILGHQNLLENFSPFYKILICYSV